MDPEDIKKYLKDLQFKSQTKEPKKLAAEIAFNCVRNHTIIEDIHANGGISQREMMIFMMEVTKNIEIALENKNGYFTMFTENIFGQVPSYWESAPNTDMSPERWDSANQDEENNWQDKILAMSDEEWHEFTMNQE